MDVENELKIQDGDNVSDRERVVQQLEKVYDRLNAWITSTKSIFANFSIYTLSTLHFLRAVKIQLQMQ